MASNQYDGSLFGINPDTGADSKFLNEKAGRTVPSQVLLKDGTAFYSTDSNYISSGATYSLFIGLNAGFGVGTVSYSTFIGGGAGYSSTGSSNANFLGGGAGYGSTNCNDSNFLGYQAGQSANGASNSNFLGYQAGEDAPGSAHSNFFGYRAGREAGNASNSIFIGKSAGTSDTVDNTGNANDFSILIGCLTSTGGYSNSIAIGGLATNTAANQLMLGSATRPVNAINLNGDDTDNIAVYTKKVTILSAALLDIGTNPVVAISAPGVGKGIQVLNAYFAFTYGTVAYSSSTHSLILTNSLTDLTPYYKVRGIGIDNVNDVYSPMFIPTTGESDTPLGNAPLYITTDDQSDPVNGDGTATFYITYKIISI